MNGRRTFLASGAAAGIGFLLPACRRQSSQERAKAAFAEGALRLELRHSIRQGAESYTVERLRAEPAWRGRTDKPDGAPDWGDYRLSLFDPDGTLLYRQGFDSSLAPGAQAATAQLSLRVPMPSRALRVTIEKRRGERAFAEAFALDLDPAAPSIERAPQGTPGRIDTLLANGAPASTVDLAILGDGYGAVEHGKFLADALRVVGYLSATPPFSTRWREFNVHAVFAPSAESGVSDAFLGVTKNTPLRCAYGTGEAERTLAVGDYRALGDLSGSAPCDYTLVLANSRRYGGSAHFGGPAVVAADSAAAKYLTLHEFAHAFAGLAEEYYVPSDDGPTYRSNIEPWHPNVTTSPAKAKWRDPSGAPPAAQSWNKAEYDGQFAAYVARYFDLRSKRADESAIEKLMADARREQHALLSKSGAGRRVGLFEGAHGYARGVYRCEVDCIMFSLQADYFCAACSAAIERAIDFHTT